MAYMDQQNAERLVNTYADLILRISYVYLKQTCDAEDICQEIFLKLLSSDLQFEQPEHEKAWIIRATINACKDHLRKAFFRKTVPIEAAAELPAPAEPDEPLLEHILQMPAHDRISLILYYYEGYSIREIAGFLGKRENTISAWLSRGRKRLRKILETEQGQENAHAEHL